MEEDRFGMEPRKVGRQVDGASRRETERAARARAGGGKVLRLRMMPTSPDAPGLNHVVEAKLPLE